jgi:CBS domain-containing protein
MQKATRKGFPHEREALLREITTKLASGRTSGTASKVVLARLIELLGADTGALFLLDEDGVTLRGAHGVWDWTRSSFRVRVDLWPTVHGALSSGKVTRIHRDDAQGLECDWFESDGIDNCICAPMVVNGRAIGMLFVDFRGHDGEPGDSELELAGAAAAAWAESMSGQGLGSAGAAREPRQVWELMLREPMLMDARVGVDVAKRLMSASRSPHALVVRDGELLGILSETALQSARDGESIAQLTRTSFPLVAAATRPEEVAHTLIETGTDYVPVLQDDEVVGVITRQELRRAGYLPGEPGVDVCLSCGNTHDLGAIQEGALVFCGACLGAASSDSLEALYNTLGGSG